jgi:NADH-quinone oxidoreductase subunit G
MSATTASSAGVTDYVRVHSAHGSITVPVEIADVVDGVVWLPQLSPDCHVARDLSATTGSSVVITAGGAA